MWIVFLRKKIINKILKKIIIITILSLIPILLSAQNPTIREMISLISEDSIYKNVKELEDFQTRFSFAENNKKIAKYLATRLTNYGFETQIDSFYAENCPVWKDSLFFEGWQYNVVSVKRSNQNTDKDYSLFLGAHYDCISNMDGFKDYMHFAPGADDNASGVACLLELARIWNKYWKDEQYNLRIEFYCNEEQGLSGSDARLKQLSSTWQIHPLAMINLDMVGYDTTNTVSLNYYDGCDYLTELARKNTLLYTDLNVNLTQEIIERSDSWVFYTWGFDALFISENDFSPYYHTLQDSSIYLNYPYMKKITALTLATSYELLNDYKKVNIKNVEQEDIKIYNDSEKLYIHLSEKIPAKIILYNINGNIIYKQITNNQLTTIPINDFERGLYIVNIRTTDNKFIKRFIK